MKLRYDTRAAAAAFLLATAGSQAALVNVVNDTFADGSPNRTTVPDANDVTWTPTGTGVNSVTVVNDPATSGLTGNVLRYSVTQNNRSMTAAFPTVGDPINSSLVSLASAGDSISFSFDYGSGTGTTASAAKGVRFALLNSSTNNGYGVGFNPGAADAAGGDIVGFTAGSPASLQTVATNAPGTTGHAVTFTMTLQANGSLAFTTTSDLFATAGNTISRNIPTPTTTSFDQIIVRFGTFQGPVFLDNAVVNANVPEPASLAAIGLTGLGLLRRRRR